MLAHELTHALDHPHFETMCAERSTRDAEFVTGAIFEGSGIKVQDRCGSAAEASCRVTRGPSSSRDSRRRRGLQLLHSSVAGRQDRAGAGPAGRLHPRRRQRDRGLNSQLSVGLAQVPFLTTLIAAIRLQNDCLPVQRMVVECPAV